MCAACRCHWLGLTLGLRLGLGLGFRLGLGLVHLLLCMLLRHLLRRPDTLLVELRTSLLQLRIPLLRCVPLRCMRSLLLLQLPRVSRLRGLECGLG